MHTLVGMPPQPPHGFRFVYLRLVSYTRTVLAFRLPFDLDEAKVYTVHTYTVQKYMYASATLLDTVVALVMALAVVVVSNIIYRDHCV